MHNKNPQCRGTTFKYFIILALSELPSVISRFSGVSVKSYCRFKLTMEYLAVCKEKNKKHIVE